MNDPEARANPAAPMTENEIRNWGAVANTGLFPPDISHAFRCFIATIASRDAQIAKLERERGFACALVEELEQKDAI